MVNIIKELSENQTILLIMPSPDYNTEVIGLAKKLSTGNVAYVTLNKTCESLKELFKKNKVNTENIVFIDAISKTFKKVPSQDTAVYYCSSPAALSEISIVINKFLKHGFDYLIFDSLTSLLVYQEKAPVAKFVSSLVNKIKASKTKAVFYALSIKEQDALIKQSGMFVDKVVELKSENK